MIGSVHPVRKCSKRSKADQTQSRFGTVQVNSQFSLGLFALLLVFRPPARLTEKGQLAVYVLLILSNIPASQQSLWVGKSQRWTNRFLSSQLWWGKLETTYSAVTQKPYGMCYSFACFQNHAFGMGSSTEAPPTKRNQRLWSTMEKTAITENFSCACQPGFSFIYRIGFIFPLQVLSVSDRSGLIDDALSLAR